MAMHSLHYACLGNPRDRGTWWALVHRSQRVTQDTENEHVNEIYCEAISSLRPNSHAFLHNDIHLIPSSHEAMMFLRIISSVFPAAPPALKTLVSDGLILY